MLKQEVEVFEKRQNCSFSQKGDSIWFWGFIACDAHNCLETGKTINRGHYAALLEQQANYQQRPLYSFAGATGQLSTFGKESYNGPALACSITVLHDFPFQLLPHILYLPDLPL